MKVLRFKHWPELTLSDGRRPADLVYDWYVTVPAERVNQFIDTVISTARRGVWVRLTQDLLAGRVVRRDI